jgi:tRNA nucleotidyltransferase (CCA-adding enzyme)
MLVIASVGLAARDGAPTGAGPPPAAGRRRETVAMDDLLQRLGELPCGRRLLTVVGATRGVHLVGGAVRDLLLGRVPRELDVVVEGDVASLAAALGDDAAAHERFGTATVRLGDCRWDLAASRAEDYARAGALPDVRPASITEDLRRRDVTVNAIALELSGGELRAVEHAFDDLAARRLRVLHDASFHDDPTRLWRVARYRARLEFELEPHTAQLARAAVERGLAERVSGARIGSELRLALTEPEPVAALQSAVELGLAPWLEPDRARTEAALALLPAGEGRPDLVVLAASLAESPDDADQRLAGLEFTAAERGVLRAAGRSRELAAEAVAAPRPSELARVLRRAPVEAVALAGADGAAEPARRWLHELRHVGLAIDGDDLLAAGVPRGPQIGRRLAATLDLRLDGELDDDSASQLHVALHVERADG